MDPTTGARLGEAGGKISRLPGAGPVRHSLQNASVRWSARRRRSGSDRRSQTSVPDLQDILHNGPHTHETKTTHVQLSEPVRVGQKPVAAAGSNRLPAQTQTFPKDLHED